MDRVSSLLQITFSNLESSGYVKMKELECEIAWNIWELISEIRPTNWQKGKTGSACKELVSSRRQRNSERPT